MSESVWSCERCATRLHEECFELAVVCPIFGCARRPLSVRARVRPAGATLAHLAWWLATFAAVAFVLLEVAPRVLHIFTRKKQSLPPCARVLWTLSELGRSWPGIAFGVLLLLATLYVYVRFRERWATRWLLVALTLGGLAFLPFAGMGLFLPIANMAKV